MMSYNGDTVMHSLMQVAVTLMNRFDEPLRWCFNGKPFWLLFKQQTNLFIFDNSEVIRVGMSFLHCLVLDKNVDIVVE